MPQLTLQTFLDEKEITLIVTSYWSITDILAVASTCKSICTTLKNCWDVDALLNRWFENAQAFRQMLGQCGAIVSGSTALQYFDRTSYSRSDVDIIIPLAGTYRMGIWLLANDFTFQPRDRDYNDFTTSLLRVINANPRGRNNRPLLKVFDFYAPPFKTQRYLRHVQLIVIYGDPFSHILQYHSSKGSMTLTCTCSDLVLHSRSDERNHMGSGYITISEGHLHQPQDHHIKIGVYRCIHRMETEIH